MRWTRLSVDRFPLRLTVGALLSIAVIPAAFADPIIPRPPGVHSNLTTGDGSAPISDDTFAQLISGALISNGASNVLDAKFFSRSVSAAACWTP